MNAGDHKQSPMGTACGLLGVFLFSLSAVMVALSNGMPTFQTLSVNLLGGGCLLLLINVMRGFSIKDIFGQKMHIYALYVFGFLGFPLCLFFSMQVMPPFAANMVIYLWPIILIFMTYFSERKRPSIYMFVGAFMAFAGVSYVFLAQGNVADLVDMPLWAWLLPLGCVVIWPTYSFISMRIKPSDAAIAPAVIFSGLVVLAAHLVFEQSRMPTTTTHIIIYVLWVFHITALLFWDVGMKRGNTRLIALVSYASPLLSFLFLGLGGFAPIDQSLLISAIMVGIGTLIAQGDRFKRDPHDT